MGEWNKVLGVTRDKRPYIISSLCHKLTALECVLLQGLLFTLLEYLRPFQSISMCRTRGEFKALKLESNSCNRTT